MKMYYDNGFFNPEQAFKHKAPFVFITGGRGTGKTYGVLKYFAEHETEYRMLFVRRTQMQVDIINKPEFCVFNRYNMDSGCDITTFTINKYNAAFYHSVKDDNGKLKATGDILGLTAALSTFANMRGMDLSRINLIIGDEFIPEPHEKTIKFEGLAWKNLYETVNRNRELFGEPPVKMILLSNSNNIFNPVFEEFGITNTVSSMKSKGDNTRYLKKMGIYIIDLANSEISRRKKDTALYQASKDGGYFEQMAIANEFVGFNNELIRSKPINEYVPIVRYDNITICKHKSDGTFYVTTHIYGSPDILRNDMVGVITLIKDYSYLFAMYKSNKIFFETAECVQTFRRVFKV